jgi:hypothetical protein
MISLGNLIGIRRQFSAARFTRNTTKTNGEVSKAKVLAVSQGGTASVNASGFHVLAVAN